MVQSHEMLLSIPYGSDIVAACSSIRIMKTKREKATVLVKESFRLSSLS